MKKFKGMAALISAAVISMMSVFSASAADYMGDVNNDGDIKTEAETTVTTVTDPVETTEAETTVTTVTDPVETTEESTTTLVEVTTTGAETTEAITTTLVEVTTTDAETTEATTTTLVEVTTTDAETTVSEVTTTSDSETSVSAVTTEAVSTTVDLSTNSIAGTDVNRAGIVGVIGSNYIWQQSGYEAIAENTTGNLVPEINGDGTYTVRLAVNNESVIQYLGVRLFGTSDTSTTLTPNYYPDLSVTIDSLIIDGEEATLADGKTLQVDNNGNANESNAGTTVYINGFSGDNVLPSGTTVNQYIEITFTVTGLDTATD
ncbi:hypothetical protein [Porcipelethomonas sp.]|uniref:hypothetical protein n=1 Tax=Porcipelethomonas sp. TaxID=2981675 RepID=UPI003EF81452